VPVPVSVVLCVPAESTTARVAVALPAAAGVKVTPMLQVPPALRLLPQVLVAIVKAEALAPPIAIEVIGRDAVPALVSVKLCAALVEPTVTLPKDAVDGVSAACGAVEFAPVPLNEAVWGEPAASSATATDALKLPAAVGPKVTEIVQFAPAARDALQVFVWWNWPASAPVTLMPLMFSTALPGFDKVSVCAALVLPTLTLPKERLAGFRVACGAAAAVPINTSLSCDGAGASEPPWRLRYARSRPIRYREYGDRTRGRHAFHRAFGRKIRARYEDTFTIVRP